MCCTGIAQDAPFVAAIGACILNSLAFPIYTEKEDDDGDEVIDSTDVRLAVMGFISFIPYFNWLVSFLLLLFIFLFTVYREIENLKSLIVHEIIVFICFLGRVGFLLWLTVVNNAIYCTPLCTWLPISGWDIYKYLWKSESIITNVIVFLEDNEKKTKIILFHRTNLSLSPEESWVPIASILLCVIHVQV